MVKINKDIEVDVTGIVEQLFSMAMKDGALPLVNKMYHKKMGDWELWFNGFRDDRMVTIDKVKRKIPRRTMYIEYKGVVFGYVNHQGGVVANGHEMSVDNLVKAMKEVTGESSII